jgi:hypothetical protein
MRIPFGTLVLFLGIGLTSCNFDRSPHREAPDARQAGRNAYRAAQAAKRDAKEVERELQHAGREFRKGWDEARTEDKSRRKKE